MPTIHQIAASEDSSHVRHEIAAMKALAAVLEGLPDDQARARVVRWAVEVFGLTTTSPVAAQPAPLSTIFASSAHPMDPLMLDQFFDDAPPRHQPRSGRELWPITSKERSGADAHDDREKGLRDTAPATKDQGVASMLHAFVSDFQSLARDWSDRTESGNRRIE